MINLEQLKLRAKEIEDRIDFLKTYSIININFSIRYFYVKPLQTKLIEDRPIFQKLVESELQKEDLVMVTKIDRCSRNTLEFLKLQDNLFQRSVTFVALDIPNSNDLATNKLIATSLSAIATFENDRRKARQQEGIEAAKKAGKYNGRKTVVTKKLIAKVKELKETKKLSVTEIAKLTEKSRATIYKVLKNELGYISNRLVKQEKKK